MSLIRVFEIPEVLPRDFHFDGGKFITFREVDWFRDDSLNEAGIKPGTDKWVQTLEIHIRGKRYYQAARAFLVLHPHHSITLNYEAP